jgi:hypothetical protein
MLKLVDAPFDRGDAKLVPKAGPCTNCPKRTGSQRELFSDIESPDLCTDPSCYQAKTLAHWKVIESTAKETKTSILTEAQAKKVFVDRTKYGQKPSDDVEYNSGFVRATDTRWLGGKSQTAKEIVGPAVKPTLALAPNGKIVELYPKDLVDKSERAVVRDAKSSTSSGSKKKPATPQQKKIAAEVVERRAVIEAIVAKAEKAALNDGHLRLLLACLAVDEYALEDVVERRKLAGDKKPKHGSTHIMTAAAKLKGGELVGLLVECSLELANTRPTLDAAATLYKVDAAAVRKKAVADCKAAEAAAKAEKAKKPASAKAVAKFKTALKAKGVKAKPAPKAVPAKKKAGGK